MTKEYNHNTSSVWEAIGVNESSLTTKLTKLNSNCVSERKKPSEKIEKMVKTFTKDELSAIIIMMEFKIRTMSHAKSKEIEKSYM